MTDITEQIMQKLLEIESKENIRIIYACESGSRAWGFASPDSDYDVRFVYVRPVEFYLRLENTKDTLECELNDVFDISGWDIRKFMKLLNKSNSSVFEWKASPIVYKTSSEWDILQGLFNRHFSGKKVLHHYNSMIKNLLTRYFDGKTEVKYKPYLYNLRQCLCCQWIMDKKSPPPIVFETLKDAYLPENLHKEVDKLLEYKKSMCEKETGPRIKAIDEYVDSVVSKVEEYLKNLIDYDYSDWNELNELFLRILKI